MPSYRRTHYGSERLRALGFEVPDHSLPVTLTYEIEDSTYDRFIVRASNRDEFSQTQVIPIDHPSSDFCICPRCGVIYYATYATPVYLRARDENPVLWCEDCVSDRTRYCAITRRWYPTDSVAFEPLNEEGHAATFALADAFTNNPDAYTYSNGRWWETHELRAREESFYSESEDFEDEDYDEGNEDDYSSRAPTDRVPEYHSISRPWESYSYSIPESDTFGVELETYAEDRLRAYQSRPEGWIGETDGSLDHYHGIEFVAPPLTWEEYRDGCEWERFLATLRSQGVQGWNAGSGYGMHVNIGRQSMSRDVAARISVLINNLPTLASDVAGRSASQWAAFERKTLARWQSHSKYEACHVKERVLEVRIFRSTLSWRGFRRNVEFCKAALDYARTMPSESDLIERKFGRFLSENASTYPNLYAHLARHWFATLRVRPRRGQVARDESYSTLVTPPRAEDELARSSSSL